MNHYFGRWLQPVVFCLLASAVFASGLLGADYDPLVPLAEIAKPADVQFTDASRQRELPLRVYLPAGQAAAPVVLFSHGLGGSRTGSAYLGEQWAGRGYAAVFVQHPGSDEGVWKEQPLAQRMAAMRKAANSDNFLLRVKDIPAVLDQLERWHKQAGHAFLGRFDLARVGMSGHSFGAVTTQAVSGQQFARGLLGSYTEPRIKAAIAFSPSMPRAGDAQAAFGGVKIPWLLMTGTHDVAAIGDQSAESRRLVFPALPPGGKYELVFDKGEHSFVTDRALPGEKLGRNPNHHRVIRAVSTAFWDAYLRKDAAAQAWLDGPGPRKLLEPADQWRGK